MSSPSTLTPWYILLFSIVILLSPSINLLNALPQAARSDIWDREGRQTTSANETGNCKSGVYPFDMSRIYVIPPGRITTVFPPLLPEVDPRTTDFTIDYTSDLVVPYSNVSVGLRVRKMAQAVGGYGTRITTTRYNLYGRFSIRMKGISAKGIITTFITMSDRGDEIDWEIVNAKPETPATTNVFFSRLPEYGKRDLSLALPDGNNTIDQYHKYTIDWTRHRIQWLIDDQLLRQYNFNESLQNGTYFYPSTPSVIQIGVWDGGDLPNPDISAWAGGKVDWGDRTFFEAQYGPLEVVCYDDQDRPVGYWPPLPSADAQSVGTETRTFSTATQGPTSTMN